MSRNLTEPNHREAPELSAVQTAPGVVRPAVSPPDDGTALVASRVIYRGITIGGRIALAATAAQLTNDVITADSATAQDHPFTAADGASEGAFRGALSDRRLL